MGSEEVTLEPTQEELQHVHELFSAANKACEEGQSIADFEPAFVALLNYLDQHPGCHAYAEHSFVEDIRGGNFCWELVSFCMHKLRLEAVRDEAVRALSTLHDPRSKAVLSHVLESFEDEWKDADMYAYYRRRA
jgi:hypothetical protein